MSYLSRRSYFTPPSAGNVSDLLLRDISSLLLTSELIGSSLVALRPECHFSNELTSMLNSLIILCDEGESRIRPSLVEAGLTCPTLTDNSGSTLIAGFFSRLPASGEHHCFATELVIDLHLLAQHMELKARIAGEEALIIGLENLGHALADWAHEWRDCGHRLGNATFCHDARASAEDFAGHHTTLTSSV